MSINGKGSAGSALVSLTTVYLNLKLNQMKKLLNTYLPALLLVLLFSFTYVQQDRKYTVSATIYEWETILQVIDQSNAPHTSVKLAQSIIVAQVQKAIQADSIRADSLKKPQIKTK